MRATRCSVYIIRVRFAETGRFYHPCFFVPEIFAPDTTTFFLWTTLPPEFSSSRFPDRVRQRLLYSPPALPPGPSASSTPGSQPVPRDLLAAPLVICQSMSSQRSSSFTQSHHVTSRPSTIDAFGSTPHPTSRHPTFATAFAPSALPCPLFFASPIRYFFLTHSSADSSLSHSGSSTHQFFHSSPREGEKESSISEEMPSSSSIAYELHLSFMAFLCLSIVLRFPPS